MCSADNSAGSSGTVMIIRVFDNKVTLGKGAAEQAAKTIQQALTSSGKARVVAASAASQFQFLDALTTTPQIDWKHVQLFHLDEYIGLPMTHPASFCRFLQEHLISRTGIRNAHLLNGEDDPAEVIRRANKAIGEAPIDIAFCRRRRKRASRIQRPAGRFQNRGAIHHRESRWSLPLPAGR